MPEEDLSKHEEWIKADNIVTSWILNSIAKEIVNVVLYASNAKELWEEILSNSKSFEMKWHALGHSLIATVELRKSKLKWTTKIRLYSSLWD